MRELLDERRFADAGLATDQGNAALARGSISQRRIQGTQAGLAFEKIHMQ
jgi:hypothetical protein